MNRPSPLKRSKCFDLSVNDITGKKGSEEDVNPQELDEMDSFLFSCKLNDYEVEMNTNQNIPLTESNDMCNGFMFEMNL